MTELASATQLRMGLLRWALVLVPAILLLGLLSGQLAGAGPGDGWFARLTKPTAMPSPARFALVTLLLYVLMGFALAMVVIARGARLRGAAIGLFALQLVLNLAWAPLLFAGHRIGAALLLLIALDLAMVATIFLFARIRPIAAWLLAPCLAWLLFVSFLTFELRALNPVADGEAPSGAVTRIEL